MLLPCCFVPLLLLLRLLVLYCSEDDIEDIQRVSEG